MAILGTHYATVGTEAIITVMALDSIVVYLLFLSSESDLNPQFFEPWLSAMQLADVTARIVV
jgi:hypothetical protein